MEEGRGKWEGRDRALDGEGKGKGGGATPQIVIPGAATGCHLASAARF